MTAACREHPDRFLFDCDPRSRPDRSGVSVAARVVAAKTACSTCDLRVACLNDELVAMRDGAVTFGIFGGTTPSERAAILRKRAVA